MVSEQGGGPDAPDTDYESALRRIQQLPNERLKAAVVDAQHRINRYSAELTLLVAELDDRALPELDEGLTTPRWLQSHLLLSPAEASGTLKTAHALKWMPTITTQALSGDVAPRSLSMLAQARDRHPGDFVLHESIFGDISTYLSARDLRRAIGHWEQQVDYVAALADVRHLDSQRRFTHNQTYDGQWSASGTFTAEGGHIVNTAINAICDPTNLSDDDRTSAQRRADAVVEISRFWLDHNQDAMTRSGEKPHITVTVDFDVLRGALAELPEIDGSSVDPNTIRRLTCDAGIIPMVLGSEAEPLDVGRKTRTIPAAMRRALEHRDHGCTWDGCTAPMSWCDAHHIVHWANGGSTSLENTTLLCRRHHTATHEQDRAPP